MDRPGYKFGFHTCRAEVECRDLAHSAETAVAAFRARYKRKFVNYSKKGADPQLCAGKLYSIPDLDTTDPDTQFSLQPGREMTPELLTKIMAFVAQHDDAIKSFQSGVYGSAANDPLPTVPEHQLIGVDLTKRFCRAARDTHGAKNRMWGITVGLWGGLHGHYSKERCCELMNRAIFLFGAEEVFSCKMVGEDFVVESADGWIADKSMGDSTRNVNPYGIRFYGFQDFADIWPRFERLRREFLTGAPFQDDVTLYLLAADYERLHVELNSLLYPWEVRIKWCGPRRPIAEDLTARLGAHRVISRIPMFHWREFRRDKENGDVFQMDAVIEADTCALELHGNYTDMKTLLERANIVPGLDFHLVER